ncbi:MAG: VOC family protein [Acidobacteria bacterium]|nr:VOC family protein [Acidobacteriota bacterium]
MATVNPYLNFDGNTEEVFDFYKTAFGGEFAIFQRYGDMPQSPDGGKPMSDADKQKIMHVSLPISEGNILMGSDLIEGFGEPIQEGNNFYISIATDSREETDKLFRALSAGGKITMPLADTFWGAYFGMFTDKFGVRWMINFDHK